MADKKKNIVILDDQADILELYELYLDKYNVITYQNAHELMDHIESSHADLYIVDLSLPDMDGIEFIRQLHETIKDESPIIIVSGVVDMDYCAKACDLQVNDIISKPFDRDQINDIVHFKLTN